MNKILYFLRILVATQNPKTVEEISKILDVDASKIYQDLSTLAKMGWIKFHSKKLSQKGKQSKTFKSSIYRFNISMTQTTLIVNIGMNWREPKTICWRLENERIKRNPDENFDFDDIGTGSQ